MNLEIIIKVPVGSDASVSRQLSGIEEADAGALPPPMPETFSDRLGTHFRGRGGDGGNGENEGNGARRTFVVEDEADGPPPTEGLDLGARPEADPGPPPLEMLERTAEGGPPGAAPPGLEGLSLEALEPAGDAAMGPPSLSELEAMAAEAEDRPAPEKKSAPSSKRKSK